MLNGYFGNTGSGKSYSVVEYVVIPSLAEQRHIYTNIPLERDLLISIYGGDITQLPPDWFEDPLFAESIPNGCVLILDEVWRKWPAGQNVRQVPVNEMALLKEHRHRVDAKGRAMRVVLVSQFPSDLASWTRKLIDVSYFMSKLDAIGASKHFHVDVVKGCPTGDRIPKKLIIQTRKGTYKPEIYQYYRSATNSETFTVGDETVADRRGNLWTSKWLWFCIVFGLVAVIGGPIFLMDSFFGRYKQPVKAPAETHIEATPARLTNPSPEEIAAANAPSGYIPPDPSQQAPSAPGEPVRSTFWRVAGFVDVWNKDDLAVKHPAALLAGPGGERKFVRLDKCARQDQSDSTRSIYVYCDIDGERVTFWSGRANFGGILEGLPMGKPVNDALNERRERSAPSAGAAIPSQASSMPVNVVPDTSRTPRTLLGTRSDS